MDSIDDESIGAHEHGFKKYRAEGLIASSVDLGWSVLSAALLSHGRGVIEYKDTEPKVEICVAISRGRRAERPQRSAVQGSLGFDEVSSG